MSDEMPNCPRVEFCHCYPEEEERASAIKTTHCVCGVSEKALRGWLHFRIPQPMTQEQREWCYDEIEAVEGWSRADYLTSTDAELAMGVLSAWMDYCRDKGLA